MSEEVGGIQLKGCVNNMLYIKQASISQLLFLYL